MLFALGVDGGVLLGVVVGAAWPDLDEACAVAVCP